MVINLADMIARALAINASKVTESKVLDAINQIAIDGKVQTGATASQVEKINSNESKINELIGTVTTLESVSNTVVSDIETINTSINNIDNRLSFIEDVQNFNSYSDIKKIVKAQKEAIYFNIGDQIMTTYSDGSATYECPWDVVHFGNVELEDGTVTNAMFLQMHFSDPLGVQFDAQEHMIATEQTAQNGVYYYGADGTSTTNTYTYLNLSVGDSIPYHKYAYVFKNSIKDTSAEIVKHGYNRYSHSAIRQYLNSTGTNWWKAKHIGDTAPEQNSNVGFKTHFSSDFLNILSKVKIVTALNTTTDVVDGDTEIVYDTFFLPSLREQYAHEQLNGAEGDIFEYWQRLIGGEVAQPVGNSDANNNRISYTLANRTSPVATRYRSVVRNSSGYVCGSSTSGTIDNFSASYNYRSRPVCVIAGV